MKKTITNSTAMGPGQCFYAFSVKQTNHFAEGQILTVLEDEILEVHETGWANIKSTEAPMGRITIFFNDFHIFFGPEQ